MAVGDRRAPASGSTRSAVLIDGSALFLSSRALYEGKQLDYTSLAALICRRVIDVGPSTAGRSDHAWVMWTSQSPQNEGQARFIDFVSNKLHWQVRASSPTDSYVVDPAAVFGLAADGRAASGRLVRFDASIAFAIGRLAETHRIVVVSDSFGLADPLARVCQIVPPEQRPTLAFFGQALDSRWQRVLRTTPDAAPEFLDLDEHTDVLFGLSSQKASHSAVLEGGFVF